VSRRLIVRVVLDDHENFQPDEPSEWNPNRTKGETLCERIRRELARSDLPVRTVDVVR
jgi:hypothetical protein